MRAKAFVKRLIGRSERSMPHVQPFPEVSLTASCRLLEGRTALVTGAGRNVGRGIALELARHGARILFTDVDATRCESLRAEIKACGGNSIGFVSDVARSDDVEELVATIGRNGEGVDVLVNNAGIGAESSLLGMENVSDWLKVYATNVFGPALLTKLIAEQMIEANRSGTVVFITSIHQWRARKDPAYSSSKAALGMIIEELALELAPHQIRVNGIAPGWVNEAEDGGLRRNRNVPLHESSIPPRYIGRAVVFLTSDHFSRYTTGSVLKIDAGHLLS